MTAARIPAAEWQAAKNRQTADDRAKLARWLRIPADDFGTFYSLLPFARIDTDDGPAIAAALPPPLPLAYDGPVTVPDDAAVLLCIPDGKATIHRVGNGLFGTLQDGAIYTDAAAYLRDWARARLLWCHHARQHRVDYHTDLHETADGHAPGTLVVGDPRRVRGWPQGVAFNAPTIETAEIINIAIWKAAHLSRAGVAQNLKAVG